MLEVHPKKIILNLFLSPSFWINRFPLDKGLIGSFMGICFKKEKNVNGASINNLTDIGIVMKVTHEVVENGTMTEAAKMIGGVTLRRFKIKKFNTTTPPYSAEVELLSDEISIEKEN